MGPPIKIEGRRAKPSTQAKLIKAEKQTKHLRRASKAKQNKANMQASKLNKLFRSVPKLAPLASEPSAFKQPNQSKAKQTR